MAITVNGVELSEAQIEAELANHQDNPSPRDGAIQQLVLHQLLLQKARASGIEGDNEGEVIGALLDKELAYTPVSEEDALAFYQQYPEQFSQGDSAEARHILFAAGADDFADSMVKAKAEGVLAELQTNPERFETLAREHSTCPSGQQGGSLGRFGRGQMVPEFEQAVFGTAAGELAPALVKTQFGYHIVQVDARHEGGSVSFDEIKPRLVQYLNEMAGRKAMHEYLASLVRDAKIEGYTMPAL
ncbi:peptidylprolyl isomerase [Crenobacter intestini]|uniref:peptidylprolyl isomerase n=1 Tax=Crenobacter intestini TaxID=2563443 RepID=A0A4T0V5K8_9NEIS|nr:peptidylprolyl isomerase [Crenobacter intestini]TIC87034.1 peptidylprolyl isomerase [Crenobacter intestini]